MCKKKVLGLLELYFLTLFYHSFKPALCIVGRDLVLTPRQGLQLTGKSIYYEENSNEVVRNLTVHPWERTLKHVTFVTLFTDAAASAVAGNVSKLKEYTDFLESPYISKKDANVVRFGDIVMLANGRLEQTGNNTFRFIEGPCGYDCQPERVLAIWQVQKIRHRDQNRNFRYEMKFSISPLRTEAQLSEQNKNRENQNDDDNSYGDMYVRRNNLKTYIQREDDYPQNFGRIIYPEETAFAQKRQDGNYMGRNFRHVSETNDYRQLTPQPTFLHGVYQPHPGLLPLPTLPPPPHRLNIGEYVKGLIHPKATPKIEIFPNVYNLMNRRNSYPAPTTFRPHYQVKLPRPEVYPPHPDMIRFPENQNDINLGQNKFGPPLVAHHYHHHFFMPGSGEIGERKSGENHINSSEQQDTEQSPLRFDKEINQQVTPNYYGYNGRAGGYSEPTTTPRQESNLPQAPHKVSFPIVNIGEHIVEVTPPTLKRPQIYPVYPINIAGKVPLLVYANPTTLPTTSGTTTLKPFIRSEPISDTVRYSEPDPLYANEAQGGAQLESPNTNAGATTHSKQLQGHPAEKEENSEVEDYEDESPEKKNGQQSDQILNQSLRDHQISPEKSNNSTEEAPTLEVDVTTTTTSTTNYPIISPPRHVTTPIPSTIETPTLRTFTQSSQFISTSTTESPLRAASRVRSGRPGPTTTESTIHKWKPKRRNHHSNVKFNSHHGKNQDKKVKDSIKKEELLSPSPDTNPTHHQDNGVLEVLTQKSVSKSISIKVGSNGEEIPFISDDVADNEVKRE